MFNVHVWAYSVLLYTVSVGFGIAYSELRAMREPYTQDKQSGRFPRSFYICLTRKQSKNNVHQYENQLGIKT